VPSVAPWLAVQDTRAITHDTLMTQPNDAAQQLIAAGMSESAAADKARLFGLIDKAISPTDEPRKELRLFVPGRIEFLGKHTDYAGGRSLLCAVERGICFSAFPRTDNRVVIRDVVRGLDDSLAIDQDLAPIAGNWKSYAMVVARRIARNFQGDIRGADIYLASDLSPAAGLSSSSVLVTAFFQIIAELNDLPHRPEYLRNIPSLESLADYLGAIESGRTFQTFEGDSGVGTQGGTQDHTAILLSEPGRLVQYTFAPTRREAVVPFPPGYTFVVAASGVVAEKTGAARTLFNRAARVTATIQELWRQDTGHDDSSLLTAMTGSPDAHKHLRGLIRRSNVPQFTPGLLLARLEQIMLEMTVLIPDAVEAIRQNDMASLGETVDLSQIFAERLLENQVPETIALARLAREQGAVAASAFGAGFGGSVYGLVEEKRAEEFRDRWAREYFVMFPAREKSAEFFISQAGPPLTKLK
jgi:galactokinase